MTWKIVLVLVLVGLSITGGAAFARSSWTPPDDTITGITGTKNTGFHVRYYNRSDDYLPTISEALAECGEYHRAVRRTRCYVSMRTWYRDLGDTKRALRYARMGSDSPSR